MSIVRNKSFCLPRMRVTFASPSCTSDWQGSLVLAIIPDAAFTQGTPLWKPISATRNKMKEMFVMMKTIIMVSQILNFLSHNIDCQNSAFLICQKLDMLFQNFDLPLSFFFIMTNLFFSSSHRKGLPYFPGLVEKQFYCVFVCRSAYNILTLCPSSTL